MVGLYELNDYLNNIYRFTEFEDYCYNGIQVEGKENIKKIVFGVSFNMILLKKAITEETDAIIVHHGIFGKNYFSLKGILKNKVKLLLENGISLIGIHLPMDAHPEFGHNAQLFKYIDAEIISQFEVGFIGKNNTKKSINQIVEIYHKKLHKHYPVLYNNLNADFNKEFNFELKYGFQILKNGPKIPENIAIISGGSSSLYEKAIENGVDTFICGEIKEQIPAISRETKTNFINIGHNNSEKPGILKLMELIDNQYDIETKYIHIDNII